MPVGMLDQLKTRMLDRSTGGFASSYASGANAVIGLTPATGPVIIRDNATPLGTSLFSVQNAAGTVKYLDVLGPTVAFAANITMTGSITVAGNTVAFGIGNYGLQGIGAATGVGQWLSNIAVGDTQESFRIWSNAGTKTAGRLFSVGDGGSYTEKWAVNFAGKVVALAANTQSTVGAAGGATVLPLSPSGYIRHFVGATEFVTPYYAQA